MVLTPIRVSFRPPSAVKALLPSVASMRTSCSTTWASPWMRRVSVETFTPSAMVTVTGLVPVMTTSAASLS